MRSYLGTMQDVQMRLARLEVFVAATVPGYDAAVTAIVKQFAETQHA